MCRLLEICCRFMSTAIEYIEIQDCASSASCVCVPDCKAANDCDWESKKKWNLCVSACVWVSKRATTTIKSHPNEAVNVRCFVDERGQSTKSYVKDFYVDTLRSVHSLAFAALNLAVSVCMCARVMPIECVRIWNNNAAFDCTSICANVLVVEFFSRWNRVSRGMIRYSGRLHTLSVVRLCSISYDVYVWVIHIRWDYN